MGLWQPRARRFISTGILVWGVVFAVASSFALFKTPAGANHVVPPRPITAAEIAAISAQATCGSLPCPPLATEKVLEKTFGQMIGPMLQAAIVGMLVNTVQFVLDRLAYDMAVWVASGGTAQGTLIHPEPGEKAWQKFGLEVAGEAIGALSESLAIDDYLLEGGFNLCAPAIQLRLGFMLGIKSAFQKPKPKCDWQSITSNWDGFLQKATTFKSPSEYALNALKDGLRPGQNTLSFSVETNIKVLSKVMEKKQTQFAEYLAKSGFKDVKDIITGSVTTPSVLVQKQLASQLEETRTKGKDFAFNAAIANTELIMSLVTHTMSVFFNTLLSSWLQKLYTGLFPAVSLEIDPFGGETANVAGREGAEDRFASLISITPTVIDQYNALTEFVVCPTQPAVRGINNCVADASLIEATLRAEGGGAPMTVAQAMEDGLLHADWPLYTPDDLIRNQDSFCYTYGYCYSNLVKLRKARVLSIGWELAASSPQNSSSSPVTLQEVVDGFDDCNSDNKLDSSHPWCHLIDPNWVLKYPTTQCRASVISEQLVSTLTAGRNGACVDTPSCIAESEDGVCSGYGYCVREKNIWKFRGDECPEQYASCLSFTNTDTGSAGSWLFTTLDFSVCASDNAGCQWYRTNKYLDDAGTSDDDSDDSYEWLPSEETYIVSERDNDVLAYNGAGTITSRASYDSNDDATNDYDIYAFEDRVYFNNNVEECAETEVGCSELYKVTDDFTLNLIRNSSFEDDEEDDGTADYWETTGTNGTDFDYDEEGSNSFHGTDGYAFLTSTGEVSQLNIPLQQGLFYTLSFYAKAATSGAAVSVDADLDLVASDNSSFASALSGLSTNCSVSGSTVTLSGTTDTSSDDFESFDCAFTTPILDDTRLGVVATLTLSGSGAYVDGIQLEVGENPTDYHNGYTGSSPSSVFLTVAPEWLGCTGEETDPDECDDYATMCSATEVGCSLYTPTDGDPAVPAVLSELDECPEECAGYAAFKQEATDYDEEEFPLYLIADTAVSCNEANVGCDEFTNLETEDVETFSQLRACVTPDMDSGAVFFTWEGSDVSGYQLVSYQLLVSDASGTSAINYTQDTDGDGTADISDSDYENEIFSDSEPESAPCTTWEVTSESTLACNDDLTALAADDDCNEHTDILEEPDCREFYDESGNIHYRLYSDTISVHEDCTAFRKTESTQTDCEASGGYWTTAGECRYFAWPGESDSCPATAAGCRSYTGGSGRNASTIFDETFESGTFSTFMDEGSTTLTISNESVATDGHSLRLVTTAADSGIATLQAYYNSADPTDTCATEDGCEVTGIGSYSASCTVLEDEESCGTLVDDLSSGKTYLLKFWAKGSDGSTLKAALIEEAGASGAAIHDFVEPENAATATSDLEEVELDGGWQLFELGPLDTSQDGYENFDENALVEILAGSASTVYIDNIELVEAEENVTLLKDSWVTPSTCDETPAGGDSPQYYLGCEAYTDQDDDTFTIYQFSSLCSESAVGCDAFYDTENSSSAYTAVYNATCYSEDDEDGDTTYAYEALDVEEDPVSRSTSCELDGEEVCTIPSGSNQCQFDFDGALPVPLPEHIVLGPETVIVPADEQLYLINDGNATCTEASVGCTEVGLPTYTSDRTAVESFASAYLLNLPDSYDNILCSNEALFCAEWSSTQDGNFYFKDPDEQACEYKTGVQLGTATYTGWFRTGTTEFCYGTGTCSDDDAISCDTDADCILEDAGECDIDTGSYLRGGDFSGIWYNGDDDYAGFGGECGSQYDLCTELIDHADTGEGEDFDGVSYFFLDNEALDEENLASSQRCNGQVSLDKGCVLFEDVVDSSLTYAASPSYLVSLHADLFFGDNPSALVDPIDCQDTDDGAYTLTTGDTVNVCEQRCTYEFDGEPQGDAVDKTSETGSNGDPLWYGRACLSAGDCPILTDGTSNEIEPTCETVGSSYAFENDTNRVLKVYRDRACAQWLACEQTGNRSWDETSGTWRAACEQVKLCDAFVSASSDSTYCDNWVEADPIVLDPDQYSARDVSWYGLEYSGYAIPNQLPIQFYEQVDANPSSWCVSESTGEPYASSGEYQSCDTDDDCIIGTCEEADEDDYRLAYVAGTCEEETGETCTVGFCEDSGDACGGDDDCEYLEACIVGYCEDDSGQECTDDSGCDSLDTPSDNYSCEEGVCVLTQVDGTRLGCVEAGDCYADYSYNAECVPGALAKTGACYNQLCLVAIDGTVFEKEDAEVQECRGYPESDSPFSVEVVESWIDPDEMFDGVKEEEDLITTDDVNTDDLLDVLPYNYTAVLPEMNTCSPYKDSNGDVVLDDSCVCSYDKAEFGTSLFRYYAYGTPSDNILSGICQGGDTPGKDCKSDAECGDVTSGTSCETLTRKDSLIGLWGYCIERDTSIYLNGGNDDEDRACLTWLPVDQLEGSTDIYAKYTSAGYPLKDTYFCSQTGYYADIYGVGVIFKSDGTTNEDKGLTTFCATDSSGDACNNDDSGEYYNNCASNVACPVGFVAAIGMCDSDAPEGDEGEICEDQGGLFGWAGDDCPYFCIPENSVHGEGSDFGESCEDGLLNDSTTSGTNNGTTWYKVGDIDGDNDHIIGEEYADCVVRGVPLVNNTFDSPYDQVTEAVTWQSCSQNGSIACDGTDNDGNGYDDKCAAAGWTQSTCDTISMTTVDWLDEGYVAYYDDDGTYKESVLAENVGFYYTGTDIDDDGLSDVDPTSDRSIGNVYLGCMQIVQVARSDDMEEPNRAWTNRVWSDSGYETESNITDNGYQFAYTYSDANIPELFGAAQFDQYFDEITPPDVDVEDYWVNQELSAAGLPSFPLPVLACDDDAPANMTIGLGARAPDACTDTWEYPLTASYYSGYDSGYSSILIDGDKSYSLAATYELIPNDSDDYSDEIDAFSGEVDYADYDQLGSSTNANPTSIVDGIAQLFGKIYNVWMYQWPEEDDPGEGSGGFYSRDNVALADLFDDSVYNDGQYDLTNEGDLYGSGYNSGKDLSAPVIASLGECDGEDCLEGSEDAFSVNEVDSGIVEGDGGSKHVVVRFFAWANPNQMPIKNVIVDWGDGEAKAQYADYAWPPTSQSGSGTEDNFYRNLRGFEAEDDPVCNDPDDGIDHFGLSSDACDTGYYQFENDYQCSEGMVGDDGTLPSCVVDDDGRLITSPCTGGDLGSYGDVCIFQPRVFVKDNWGWCTGVCDGGADGTEGCYDGSVSFDNDSGLDINECDFDNCPEEDVTGTASVNYCGSLSANPWINFDGYVIVEP